ncbi:hypothetical protein [Spirosoma sp. 48-14]|nr:hypothetical protein [Spirosoma sp. 48-14]
MALVKDGQYNSFSRVICGPTSLSLLAYPDELYSNNSASYRWTGPDNFVSNEQNPVVTQGGAGLYILEATYPNNCGVGRDTVQIYNAAVSIGSYAVGSTQYANTFCQGTSAELRASISAMSGTTASYQWRGPNGFISGGQSLTLTDVSKAMEGTYSVTATFSGGCSGSAVSS